MYRIKNWKKFQHYKDRDPLWIKLHLSLMKDLNYLSLTDKAKITLIHCWMVGAEMWKPEKEVEPLLPSDGKLLKTLLKLDGNIRTNEIKLAGYLIPVPNDYNNLLVNPDSDLLADSKQDDTLELEVELELEKDIKPKADDTQDRLKDDLRKIMEQVNTAFPKFNPYQYHQQRTTKDGHLRPMEVWIDLWTRLLRDMEKVRSPHAWCNKVFSVEAGNVEAGISEEEHKRMKQEESEFASDLGNIAKDMN